MVRRGRKHCRPRRAARNFYFTFNNVTPPERRLRAILREFPHEAFA